jgi:hypothetical protein
MNLADPVSRYGCRVPFIPWSRQQIVESDGGDEIRQLLVAVCVGAGQFQNFTVRCPRCKTCGDPAAMSSRPTYATRPSPAEVSHLAECQRLATRSGALMTDKIDFKKTLDAFQAQRGRFRIVEVPDMHYLMIDGRGDPNTSPAFTEAVAALYPVAYKLKFASKRNVERDYVVPPLEGLWWAEAMDTFTTARDKSRWDWTIMLMVPDWIDQTMFATASRQARAKNPPTRLDDVRFENLSEGQCVQTLHVGSFDDEAEILARLHHEFIPHNGLRMTGRHHEIYLSDFRRVAPGKQRTILRQPVIPTAGPGVSPRTDQARNGTTPVWRATEGDPERIVGKTSEPC